MPNLQQLIAEQKNLSRRSYGDYEARAGYVISRQRWQQLGTGARIKEFSEPATIKAMAEALEVDVAVVVLAMAKSLGLPIETGIAQSDLAVMLPPSARNLNAEQCDAIVRLVRVFAPEEDVTHAVETTSQPSASPEGDKDEEARRFVVLRCDPDESNVIIQGPSVRANDDHDARDQLRAGLALAGMTIDPTSDWIVTVARFGNATTLTAIVRDDDNYPAREEHAIAKLRERGDQLMRDRRLHSEAKPESDRDPRGTDGDVNHGETGGNTTGSGEPVPSDATAAAMTDEQLRAAAAIHPLWADYIKTKRPELVDWDF